MTPCEVSSEEAGKGPSTVAQTGLLMATKGNCAWGARYRRV